MIRKALVLSLATFALVSTSFAADANKPNAAAAAKKPAGQNQTVTIVIKDLIPTDGGVIIKPEGGGTAYTLNQAANNKAFTAAKMEQLFPGATVKLVVNGLQVVDILD